MLNEELLWIDHIKCKLWPLIHKGRILRWVIDLSLTRREILKIFQRICAFRGNPKQQMNGKPLTKASVLTNYDGVRCDSNHLEMYLSSITFVEFTEFIEFINSGKSRMLSSCTKNCWRPGHIEPNFLFKFLEDLQFFL